MLTWAPEEKQIVEEELFRIAGSLLHTISPDAVRTRLEEGGSLDLFNGTAGVILCCLRLYERYQIPVYLEACQSATETLLQHPAVLQQEYYTLYTGATGLLYLCIKMYEATGKESYLSHALRLLKHFEHGILEKVVQDDFISGHAGNIFLLTYLHAHTQHDSLSALIRQLTDKIIHQARIAPQGLRWGHIKRSFDCLTGFSHGASGIAYALLHAARHFRDEGLYYLAQQALAYEMLYYDEPNSNWLDLRLTSTLVAEEDILDWGPSVFRKYASNVNSWAHGAAGIGLARLYAWQLTGEDTYSQHIQVIIQRSLQDLQELKRGDFTLCSGYGGVAAFLSQAAAVLQRPELHLPVQQTALAAVRYYQQHGTYNSYVPGNNNDPGLFSGMAGVGYLLLNALFPDGKDAITHPAIPVSSPATPLCQPGEVKMLLFSPYYKSTISILQLDMEDMSAVEDIQTFEALLLQRTAALPSTERLKAQDCYTFEHGIANLWKRHKGLLYYTQYKELLQVSALRLLDASDAQLLQTILLPAADFRLCSTPSHYLSYCHEYGVTTFPVGKLTVILLNALAPGRSLQEIIRQILDDHFIDTDKGTQQQILKAVIDQVRSLLRQGFITGA
ncbi:MAG TPA: lanthionine synthetase LanC family protein [Chitinophaga sp.]